MKNLSEYIMLLDNAMPAEMCESLITKFNESKNLVKRDNKWLDEYRSFKELNITKEKSFAKEQQFFYNATRNLYQFYKEKTGIQFFPTNMGYEEVRMKRYDNNSYDQFGWHTDVGDYASARRFLVMFFYLNTIEEGGETVFEDDIIVKPRQGSVIMFPPMWMYPHKANQPISSPKYIISTYCHYK